MAQKIVVSLVDDLDGGKADETVEFSLDGKNYEIDLSDDHATAFRDALATYVAAGRRPGRAGRGRARTVAGGTSTGERERNQAIRYWARTQGMKVSERGRIPSEVIDAYDEANRHALDETGPSVAMRAGGNAGRT
ncbi:MAG TPA: Lsr2 family protein [Pseudonocardiaceae bacterium]|nr:Lsr2 family protein [Pseudonocardiaceae bacterium]